MPGGHSPWQQERSISWTKSPPGAARSRKRAEDRRKSHGTGATSGLQLPARAPCPLAGRCTQRQRVMEETSAATGAALLLPLLHAALAQATSVQPSPRSAGTLQQQGAGTQAQAPGHGRDTAHCLARARPSTSWPCAQAGTEEAGSSRWVAPALLGMLGSIPQIQPHV